MSFFYGKIYFTYNKILDSSQLDLKKKGNITFQVIKKMEKSNKEMLKIMEQNRTVRLC